MKSDELKQTDTVHASTYLRPLSRAQGNGRVHPDKKSRGGRYPRYVTRAEAVAELSEQEQREAALVSEKFVFRTNEYYQSLIDWDDPNDPIRRIIMPDASELEDWGLLDASDEESYTVVPGLEHKYRDTALMLVNDVCGGYCRFCFRKRLFMDDNDEVVRDISGGIEYVKAHPEVSNVLLTGGDPLILSTKKLAVIFRELFTIPHVRIIRIGTKMTAFNPYRVLDDPDLAECIQRFSTGDRRIYIMAHYNHPRELTEPSREALGVLQRAGAITVNQTPILRGVNDDPDTLRELFTTLSEIGVPPYYLFQCRPTEGNRIYSVPLEESAAIFDQARQRCSGLGKRARLVMSHRSGKIEIVGVHDGKTYFRYHQAADPEDAGRFMVFDSNPEAYWFDDYLE
jgi:lysine 2,3-aminomutase